MFKSLVCAFALVAAPTAASAESLSVKTADLDLSTEAGAKKLDQRILAAARKICGTAEDVTGSRLPSISATDCVQRATRETRQKIAAGKAKPAG